MPKTESETELKLLILLWPNGGQKGAPAPLPPPPQKPHSKSADSVGHKTD